jgi:hypothetical protein
MRRILSWWAAIQESLLAFDVRLGQTVRSAGSFHGPGAFCMPFGAGIGFGQGFFSVPGWAWTGAAATRAADRRSNTLDISGPF